MENQTIQGIYYDPSVKPKHYEYYIQGPDGETLAYKEVGQDPVVKAPVQAIEVLVEQLLKAAKPKNEPLPVVDCTVDHINELIGLGKDLEIVDPNQISDGYHTIGELYAHRIANFVAMLRTRTFLLPDFCHSDVWRSLYHSDGSNYEGWFILGLFKAPGKQITYHLPLDWWSLTNFAETLDRAPDWDGHTPADVLQRLKNIVH